MTKTRMIQTALTFGLELAPQTANVRKSTAMASRVADAAGRDADAERTAEAYRRAAEAHRKAAKGATVGDTQRRHAALADHYERLSAR